MPPFWRVIQERQGNVELKTFVRDIPDWPKEGVVFKDITPLLLDPNGFKNAIDSMAEPFADVGIDHVLGAEARGFILGGALA